LQWREIIQIRGLQLSRKTRRGVPKELHLLGRRLSPLGLLRHVQPLGQAIDCDRTPVRKILESAGNIRAVFQGHCHGGYFQTLASIPHVTLRAMCQSPGLQNNAFGIATFRADGSIHLEGFGQQALIDIVQRRAPVQ